MKSNRNLKSMMAAMLLLAVAGVANATVDAGITASVQQYGTDGVTYATAIMSASFAIWAVKKLARKMGWF